MTTKRNPAKNIELKLLKEKWYCPVCNREAVGCYILENWLKVTGPYSNYIIHYNCLKYIIPKNTLKQLKVTGYRNESGAEKIMKGKAADLEECDYIKFSPGKEYVGPLGSSKSLIIKNRDEALLLHLQFELNSAIYGFKTQLYIVGDDGGRPVIESGPTNIYFLNLIHPQEVLDTFNALISGKIAEGFTVLNAPGDVDDYMDKILS